MKKYRKQGWEKSRGERPSAASQKFQLKPDASRGITIVIIFALAGLFILGLFNLAGSLGRALEYVLKIFFGWGEYVVPFILLALGYSLLKSAQHTLKASTYAGLILWVISYSGLLHLWWPAAESVAKVSEGKGGGYFGLISYPLLIIMGKWATLIFLIALFVISLLIMFNTSLQNIVYQGGILGRIYRRFLFFFQKLRNNLKAKNIEEPESNWPSPKLTSKEIAEGPKSTESPSPEFKKQLKIFPEAQAPKALKKLDIPLDLLEESNSKPTSGDIELNKEKIRKTLENFGITVEMDEVNVGPTVTQFTLKPTEGVKISQITTLANDLALALAVHPIRIEAPIPGKSLVGIEIPNQAVALVKLKEILSSQEFKKRKSKLAICLGKDVSGRPYVTDLDPMPHLLVAGATGSGKSVCINSIILSLLYQNSPYDLKLILVDPKRVEFNSYNGLPHLLTPVITEVDKTINALRWVVGEMDRRFQLLSQSGKRNIQAYHREVDDSMPYLVVIIDELADLMAVAAREVEAAIIRLAQMARAVGIHLVVATQRPSVDIITGLIKANITSRIAFNVASLIDSRTILDHSGAEKLLGNGDMLFISSELSKPKRLQGAFITDQEIERVTGFLKSKAEPTYVEEIVNKQTAASLEVLENVEDDELLNEAKEIVLRAGKASASLLQRRLRVGYARAARLLDLLEERGIIGPGDGAKPREILVANPYQAMVEPAEESEESIEEETNDANDNSNNPDSNGKLQK